MYFKERNTNKSKYIFNERVKILPGSKIKIVSGKYVIFNNGADIIGTKLRPINIFGNEGGNILINNLKKNSSTNIDYLNTYKLGKSSSN